MATIGQSLTSPETGWKRIDNTDSNFVYDSNWTTHSNASHYGGSAHMLSAKTGKMEFYFYGTKLRLICHGVSGFSDQIKVTIDNSTPIIFSTNNSVGYQGLFYEQINLTKSTHKVVIENLVPLSVRFDAIDIDSDGYMTTGYINKVLISSTSGNVFSILSKNKSTVNIIPAMTSNTSPSGVASASSIFGATNDAWKGFDGTASSWRANSLTTGWLQYEFPTKYKVNKYSVTSSATTTYTPKSWTFEGSNDGLVYTILDTQNNVTSWFNSEEKVFSFENINPYKYYRINISSNNGGIQLEIAELKMFDNSVRLIYVEDYNENDFINFGNSIGDSIGFDKIISTKAKTSKTSTTLGSGKVFKTTIDTTKIPIKSVTIK